ARCWPEACLENYLPALAESVLSSFSDESALENGFWMRSISGEIPWNASTSFVYPAVDCVVDVRLRAAEFRCDFRGGDNLIRHKFHRSFLRAAGRRWVASTPKQIGLTISTAP